MKQSTYLYGRNFDAQVMRELSYVQALEYKILCATGLVSSLCEADTLTTDWKRISVVSNAIKFNKALLAEAFGKDIDV